MATRVEKIMQEASGWPEFAHIAVAAVEDGSTLSEYRGRLLRAISGAGSPGKFRRLPELTEALGDFLALRILGDLPASTLDRSHRISAAEEAGDQIAPFISRHGILRGVAESVSPPGPADNLHYRALSTSDFVNVTRDALNTLLVAAYEGAAEQRPWEALSRTITVKDFRVTRTVRVDVPALTVTAEGAPVTSRVALEQGQSFRVEEYTGSIDISRQLLVNDELGALRTMAEGVATAASRTVGNAVFALLQSNPTLGDGIALFHSSHANTGAAPLDVTGLGTTLARIRNQLSIAGERMNLVPDHILIAPGPEAVLRTLLGSFGQNGEDLTPLFEGRLTPTTTYYCIASDAPGLAIAAIEGSLTPSIVREQRFHNGIRYHVVMAFAPLFLDFRTWARATA